ncbi:Serine/threonine/tyrosine-interacting protein A [Orchesella cincta]|uniref:Serine/threonine/tyrosine-interacting protein A n=1 Tax=Orchesella cincta TaxID=48709 RepID=A0A1D2M2Q4_ORCCI|nr:Serine/threonine/tyrosine-interacting protein A [Orchesella cincta]
MNHGEVEVMEESPVMEEGMTGAFQSMDLGVDDSDKKKEVLMDRYPVPNYPPLPSSKGQVAEEWLYHMRRNMQEIIPGLFLGPYACASRAKLDEMKEAGLTHVVVVRQFMERNLIRANHPDHFKYLIVEIMATLKVSSRISKLSTRLSTSVYPNGGKALVHGSTGNSRSAALVLAYIMSKFGVSLNEASSLVKSKRYSIRVNNGFMDQLREYEPIYRALHSVPDKDCDTRTMKRKLYLDDDDAHPSPSSSYQFGAVPLEETSSFPEGGESPFKI